MNNNFNNCNNLVNYNNTFNCMNNNFSNQLNPNFNLGNKNNNFFYNFSNLYFMMSFLQNQIFKKRFYEMMFQQYMFNYLKMQMRFKKMNDILNNTNNNNNNNINYSPNNESNEIMPYNNLSPELIDVMKEPDVIPQINLDDNDNDFGTNFSNDLNTEILTAFMNLNPDLLSGFGNNLQGIWPKNEYRGGKKYSPPRGWIAFGLNVINKYDNGNNDWLACNGRIGEWCVAYHGAGRGKDNHEVKSIIKSILTSNLKAGNGQSYKDSKDINHPGRKVGVGVYCSPDINVLESYAGVLNIQGKKYKVGFMLRVKPDRIRCPSSHKNYWVLNGDFSELRPYRLLIRRI